MNFDSHTRIRRRILRSQLCGDRIHRNLGLMFAQARPQPRNHLTRMRTAVIYEAFFSKCSDHRQKKIVISIAAAVEIEVGGKNADDCPAGAVEIDFAPNHRRIGIETSPPQCVTDYHHACGARFVFVFAKEAPDLRLNA